MGLSDRDYMLRKKIFLGKKKSLFTKKIFYLVVGLFIIEYLFNGSTSIFLFKNELAFKNTLGNILSFFLVSNPYNVISVLFDLYIFYIVSKHLELFLSKKNLIKFIFLAIVFCYVLLIFFPYNNNKDRLFDVILYSLLVYFALSYKNLPLNFLFLFLLPIRILGKHILYILVFYKLFDAIIQQQLDYVFVFSFCSSLMIYFLMRESVFFLKINNIKNKLFALGHEIFLKSKEKKEKEFNRILDKISKQGLSSLTKEEKKTLENYDNK